MSSEARGPAREDVTQAVTQADTEAPAPAWPDMSEYRTDVDQSHTQDLHFRLQVEDDAGVADPASEGDDVLHLLNSTDAPISESVYIVCGVLIAMVLVGLIIVLLAVTISKLRKREETNNNSLGHGHGRPQAPALAPALVPHADTTGAKVSFAQSHNGITTVEAAVAANNTTAASLPTAGFAVLSAPVAVVANNSVVVNTTVASASPPTSCPDSAGSGSDSASSGMEEDDEAERADGKSAPFELFLWSYPNPTTFSGTKDALVRELPCEVPQDSKGLRKNLRGKWKRLVKKKPEDSGGIPPELRDQLKQIYVY